MNDRRRPRECFEDDVSEHVCLDPFCGCNPQHSKFEVADDPWVAFFGSRKDTDTNATRWYVPEASPFATSLRAYERLMALISRAENEPVHQTDAQ